MKILKIRFKNLNSLEGEWEIDFSHPVYTANGIFAITGPTGAGKTTLLDAICLALYGRTPRLKIISKSTNEIMTRQTGECFAEVTFTTLKGCYRCHWSQHRARKKAQGDLQQPRHEIVDHDADVVLENTIKNVAARVEAVTGMTFDQFTRSILLAQGSFAAFLQASADDRAPLLEQITGTEVYSRISQKVHHHTARQQRNYMRLSEELDGMAILTDEEKAALKIAITEKSDESGRLRAAIDTIRNSIAWLETISNLKNEIQSLEDQYSDTLEKQRELSSQRSLFERAKSASLYQGQYAHLQHLKNLQEEEIQETTQIEKEQRALQSAFDRLGKEHIAALRFHEQAEENLEKERKLAIEVKTLDAQITDREERRAEEEKKHQYIQLEQEKRTAEIQRLKDQLQARNKDLDHCLKYLEEHRADAALLENLAVLNEKNDQLQIKLANLDDLKNQLEKICSRKNQTLEALQKAKNAHEDSSKAYDTAAAESSRIPLEVSAIRREYPQLHKQQERYVFRLSQLEKLDSLYRERQKTIAECEKIKEKLETLTAELDTAKRNAQDLKEKCDQQEQLVAQQEELFMLKQRIKSYEEERAGLRSGVPCPLCGSTTHPFSENTPPHTKHDSEALEKERKQLLSQQNKIVELQTKVTFNLRQQEEHQQHQRLALQQILEHQQRVEDLCHSLGIDDREDLPQVLRKEINRIKTERSNIAEQQEKLEKLEDVAAELRKSVETLKEEQNSWEGQLSSLNLKLTNFEEKEVELHEKIKDLEETINRDVGQLTRKLMAFGITSPEHTRFSTILKELEQRLQKWQEAETQQHTLRDEQRLTENTLQKEQAKLDSVCRESELIQQSLKKLNKELSAITQQRRKIYGDKNPDREEHKYSEQLSASAKNRDEIRENLRNNENKAARLADRLTRLSSSISKRAEQLRDEEEKLLQNLQNNGFAGLDEFATALLSEEKILELERIFKELDENTTRLKTLLEEKKHAFTTEHAKNLTSESSSTLCQSLDEKNDTLNLILQEIGKVQGKLEDNERLLKEQQRKRKTLAEQEKELQRWQKLDHLIGSANGKKFRNFAQGITFEIMVELANKNLIKMTDRYMLIRDSGHPLELQIIDNYRAGDTRSTQNLSGGESFLVSLALALGLSNMAGSNIRVDSFFLDEGFGTLDEETLDTALQTLAGLQQEGKMIGIISHVSLLKERLDTRIQIVPGTGGHSIIQGPGVRTL